MTIILSFILTQITALFNDENVTFLLKIKRKKINTLRGLHKDEYVVEYSCEKEVRDMSSKDVSIAKNIAKEVAAAGGVAYFVGGCVRDSLMGIESTDIDVEIHGISPETLEGILDSLGERLEFGKSFGVYSLSGTHLDIAMPRRESVTGHGHKDFKIDIDPFIGTKNAAKRRDFTVNALMKNVMTGEIVDHFEGRTDLGKGVLRHVDDSSFPEDPLRVLRAAQFAARFDFEIAPETMSLCSKMDISTLSRERVFAETEKALLKADKPSKFFELLREMGQLSVWFFELEALIGLPQNAKYHTEGDVWRHTMMVLDEAALRRKDAVRPLPFMISALVHDLGKIDATTVDDDGVVHAYAHETNGLSRTQRFLSRLSADKALTEYVLNMCKLHMKPNVMAVAGSKIKKTNALFDEAAEPADLILLALSDARGKTSDYPFVDTAPFLWERFGIYKEYMSRPYVMGRDLIDAGIAPSEKFSDILEFAHSLRLGGIPKDTALKETLSYAKKKLK